MGFQPMNKGRMPVLRQSPYPFDELFDVASAQDE